MHKELNESHLFQETCLLEMLLEQKRQRHMLGVIMLKTNELAGKLNEQAEIVQKIFIEVAALKEALANLENIPVDAETALANLSSIIKSVDDQNPDAEPAPEPLTSPQPLEGSIIDNGVLTGPAIDPETGLPIEPAAENTDQATL